MRLGKDRMAHRRGEQGQDGACREARDLGRWAVVQFHTISFACLWSRPVGTMVEIIRPPGLTLCGVGCATRRLDMATDEYGCLPFTQTRSVAENYHQGGRIYLSTRGNTLCASAKLSSSLRF